MLRIEQITLREMRLPLREPFRISSGVIAERRIALLEIRDGDGGTAWSECVAFEQPNYSPETIDTAWLAISEWVAPRVLGRTFSHPREIFPALERDFRGHLMAKAAVEMGAWVLAAESGRARRSRRSWAVRARRSRRGSRSASSARPGRSSSGPAARSPRATAR